MIVARTRLAASALLGMAAAERSVGLQVTDHGLGRIAAGASV
jgi:hypothetical protein